ncbi:mycofactocin-coupled SDR family oxidoreductase [Pseudonocardia sp. C8]|uniref:mycofactocin-coupled SDR family oxidoreductase n=1 Tax=Pseudonocardia sp. C8 TaxID=2762759 RepID=UPI001642A2A8|nr:mycofactocin-coupled SDR family oxidoreductase [Pseudonocardia sp. C8]MBC3191796.1 mycofactocin-coupled SDR family oxidoreductase [Pseudonocardia sp. C8]
MGLLDGKVALVTGAARGQGRAHALTCAREGADVIALDTDKQLASVPYGMGTAEELAETAKAVEHLGRRVLTARADVRDQAAVDDAVACGLSEFGQIDILIANAGIWTRGAFWELSDDQWDEMIGVNLTGVWRTAKAVAPHMIERQTGSIVIIASANGLEPGANYAHYCSAKHGAIGLMKNIALELAPHGIRANAICPGAIETPMTDHQAVYDMFAGHEGGTREDKLAGGYHFHALKGATFLDPQVIADAALYLNSPLASAVTGVALPVDAGHMILTGLNMAPVTG